MFLGEQRELDTSNAFILKVNLSEFLLCLSSKILPLENTYAHKNREPYILMQSFDAPSLYA